MSLFPQIIACECEKVKYQASAAPIVTAVCYCEDCQDAGDIIETFDDVKPFREADGGTPYVTLHDRHWTALEGEALLKAVKLKPDSPTTRYVTTCCHSPLFIKFESGFWTSSYRMRYENPPPLEWRNKIAKRRSSLPYTDDIPRFKTFPLRLFGRLFKAWIFKG